MKAFVALFALAALASADPKADADPAYLYGGLGYGYNAGLAGYNGLHGYGYNAPIAHTVATTAVHAPVVAAPAAVATVAAPAVASVAAVAPVATYANAGLYNPYNFGYARYAGYGIGHGLSAYSGLYSHGYAGYAHHGLYKRDADAVADADPAYLYGGYSGYNYGPRAYAGYNYGPRAYSGYYGARTLGYNSAYNYGRYAYGGLRRPYLGGYHY